MLMRRSLPQVSSRSSALLFSASTGREGAVSRLGLVAGQQLLLSSTRALAIAPATATLRSARKKLDNPNRLTGIERLTADEAYEVLQARFAEHGKVRTGFVTHLFRKAETSAHIDNAMEAFYYAQSMLVEPNEHMIWEIIHACTRVGEPQRALELIANTRKYRVWPITRQYNRLMSNLLAAGDHQGAVQAYEALRKRGTDPDAYTLGLLVRAHAEQGNNDKAVAVADEAKRVLQVDTLPGPVADALMAVHWKSQNFDALRSLVAEQTAGNTTRSLDGALYASLAHLQSNNVSAAADLVRHAAQSEPATPEQFEKWANTLAEEATSASLAQPAAGLLRALTDVAPVDVHATLENLAVQLEAEAASAPAPEQHEEASAESKEVPESAEKKEEAQA